MNPQSDLIRASLESIVLEVIAGGATYGYEIAKAIKTASGGKLLAQQGTLYPALHRLEKKGFLASLWETSPGGRKRKHYKLTPLGKKEKVKLRTEWVTFSQTVDQILGLENTRLAWAS